MIEDALEIDYRQQQFSERFPTGGNGDGSPDSKSVSSSGKLPSLSNNSPKKIDHTEDVLALREMIADLEDLLMMPNIRVLLPRDFPSRRYTHSVLFVN